jgi:hypothetical protein
MPPTLNTPTIASTPSISTILRPRWLLLSFLFVLFNVIVIFFPFQTFKKSTFFKSGRMLENHAIQWLSLFGGSLIR